MRLSPSERNDQNKGVKDTRRRKGFLEERLFTVDEAPLGVEGKNLDTIEGSGLPLRPQNTQRIISTGVRTVNGIGVSRTDVAGRAMLPFLFGRLIANGFVRFLYLFRVPIQPLQVIQESGVFRAVQLSFFRACGRESIFFIRQMNPVTHFSLR